MPKILRKKPNYLFLISSVFLLSFIIWNYHSSWLVSQLSLETAHQGLVTHEKTVKALYANTEIVLTTPVEGKITMIQEEGQRFRKGETLVSILPTGIDYAQSKEEALVTAPISGLFYSYRDGLEQVITPENLMNMDLSGLLSQVESRPQTENLQNTTGSNNDAVSKHFPVGKMVNNLYPSWMFVYLENVDITMIKDDTVKFIIENQEYLGTVMKISGQPKGAVVRFTQYVKGTTENRVKDVIWKHKASTKGLLVPVSALCTFGEEKGVYIGDQGIIHFKNVKVLDYNESVACVEGIPEGAQVITNPRKGIAGLAIKKKT